jgi:hypothetical protein
MGQPSPSEQMGPHYGTQDGQIKYPEIQYYQPYHGINPVLYCGQAADM